MMLLHFLQRILKTLPWTLSSEIEYLAWQASQTIFIVIPAYVVRGIRPLGPQSLGEMLAQSASRVKRTGLLVESSVRDRGLQRSSRTARRPCARWSVHKSGPSAE